MKRALLIAVAIAILAVSAAGLWAVRGLSDFDLSDHDLRELSFEIGGSLLSGTLVKPKDVATPPIAILVHGDGPQDRFSQDGYLPLINMLVDAGIGVFSWDKAGVEASTGNWLHQTMDDRADVAMAAFDAVAEIQDIDPDLIGFLGFSQAGWVLPRVANRMAPAFTVIVGGAVSWRDQGTYFARVEMEAQGEKEAAVELRLMDRTFRNDMLFLPACDSSHFPEMETDRFRFVAAAYWENSTDLLSGMTGPVLAIWGDADLNVDARSDAEIYRDRLAPLSETRRVELVPNATHGLLRADLFNFQLASQWPWHKQVLFVGMGRRAYAEHSIDQIANWIKAATES